MIRENICPHSYSCYPAWYLSQCLPPPSQKVIRTGRFVGSVSLHIVPAAIMSVAWSILSYPANILRIFTTVWKNRWGNNLQNRTDLRGHAAHLMQEARCWETVSSCGHQSCCSCRRCCPELLTRCWLRASFGWVELSEAGQSVPPSGATGTRETLQRSSLLHSLRRTGSRTGAIVPDHRPHRFAWKERITLVVPCSLQVANYST